MTHIRRSPARYVSVLLLLAAACSSGESAVTQSSESSTASTSSTQPIASTVPSSSAPTTIADQSSTTTPTAPATSTTISAPVVGPRPSDAKCRLSDVPATPTITFVSNDKLWELSSDYSTATCVVDLQGNAPDDVRWSPGANRVLISPNRVFDKNGFRDTGYFANNAKVKWSYPTGKALIAPAVKDGALLWRSSTDASTRLDISFLARTEVASYHVAGKNIVAAGVAADGTSGLFVASNRGANAQPIALLEDPATAITEIVPDTDGTSVYFLHDHGSSFEVHQVLFPSLVINDLVNTTEPIAKLTVSSIPSGGLALRVGDCATLTRTVAWQGGALIEIGAGTALAGQSTTPVGWLDSNHLVVAARAQGCSGPADVYVAEVNGTATMVAGGLDNISVRAAVTNFGEIPNDLNADAEY